MEGAEGIVWGKGKERLFWECRNPSVLIPLLLFSIVLPNRVSGRYKYINHL